MISVRRSRGEESREEKRMLGPGSWSFGVVEMVGVVDGFAVVGGLEVTCILADEGDCDSRIEA